MLARRVHSLPQLVATPARAYPRLIALEGNHVDGSGVQIPGEHCAHHLSLTLTVCCEVRQFRLTGTRETRSRRGSPVRGELAPIVYREVNENMDLLGWLRQQCAEFVFLPAGVYVEQGQHEWPLVADGPEDLTTKLDGTGHLSPLPKESAALANVIEVALVDFLLARLDRLPGAAGRRGEERSYPDLEISGDAFGGAFHAVDIKMARLAKNGVQTQSRSTLYTGNTYFKWPTIRWPGMFRPFDDYASHLDIIGVYRLDVDYRGRVRDLQLFVQEPWRIASKERSSTTREYIGAVNEVAALREGRGEFETEGAFYKYWRAYPFRVPKAVERQLQKALREQPR